MSLRVLRAVPTMHSCVLALLLVACRGAPILAGSADVRLGEWVAVQQSRSPGLTELLDEHVEAWHGDDKAIGPQAAAQLLAALPHVSNPRVLRHHDVSLIELGGGRVLFLQRNERDRIIKVADLRAPNVNDGVPWWGAYYDRAWNLDDPTLRLALLRPVWGDSARYVDPGQDLTGPDAVSEMIGRLRSVARGSQILNTTGLADAGGGWWTWDWVMKTGGITFFRGFDLIHLGSDGKIEFLAGFFDKRSGP